MGQAVPAAREAAWGSTRDARSERGMNFPWRLPVLSRERRVTQGSVQDFGPMNPGSPRWVFSQTFPFSACLHLSSTGQDGGSAGSCLHSHTGAPDLAFSPITGPLSCQPSQGPLQLLSTYTAALLPSAPVLLPSICTGTLTSAAAALTDVACLLSTCMVGGCWPAPALPEGLPYSPAAAFSRPSLNSRKPSVPAGAWSLHSGALSLFGPVLSLQPPG